MSRLLLLTTDLHRGGTPTVVREVSRRLKDHGADVEVACLDSNGVTGTEIAASGIPVHPLGARGVWDVTVTLRLARLVRTGRFRRVLSLLVHANAIASAAKVLCGPDVRWFQSVQTTQPDPDWHWQVQAAVAAAAELILVPSPSVALLLTERCGIAPERIRVVPNGVDAASFGSLPLTRSPSGPVGFIGRLDPVKRVGDLIAAAGELPGQAIRIWGDGVERKRLESLAEAARRRGADVRLNGEVASAHAALAECQVLVLPSAAEGFGMVLIEAMAAGVPVVAARSPGIVDIVRHGENGLLYEPGNVHALAAAVRQTLAGGDAVERRIRSARSEVLRTYDWEAIIREYRRLLSLDSV